jgi:hypothetical protein
MRYPIHGSKYFDVREFVDIKTFALLGEKSAWLIDPAIVRVCDLLRELSGVPVTLNNWHVSSMPAKKQYKSSGYRAIWDMTGGQLSQHRCGRAADVKVFGMLPADVHHLVNANKEAFLAAGLTAMESLAFTPSWTHLDCRPRLEWMPKDGFLIVEP